MLHKDRERLILARHGYNNLNIFESTDPMSLIILSYRYTTDII